MKAIKRLIVIALIIPFVLGLTIAFVISLIRWIFYGQGETIDKYVNYCFDKAEEFIDK